uniref:SSD domain-containing protein n=1 Tax=Plectus sambesii TaxID=2011161 RepID=A0A914USQ6_9BILA
MIAASLSALLRSALSHHGRFVASYPLPFLILPIALTCGLCFGFTKLGQLSRGQNSFDLYIPHEGLSRTGRDQIKQQFGTTYMAELDPINGVTFCLIVKRHDGGNILSSEFFAEYTWLRKSLEAISVPFNGSRATYAQLCLRDPRASSANCLPDFVEAITQQGIEGYTDIMRMRFPDATVRPPGYVQSLNMRVPLGGVILSSRGFIVSAEAAQMTFHFPFHNHKLAREWEAQMRDLIKLWSSSLIDISWLSVSQFQRDADSMAIFLRDLTPSLLMVILVFCIGAGCVADWVHSKPDVAVGGVLSAIAAIGSGFGLSLLLDVPVVDIVFVAPFLILSVGVDDMFIMLAAWRKTSCTATVQDRLAQTFADAAVSVTITSLTDGLAFAIGAVSVFPAVRYFCCFCVASICFTYLYQITLFAAFMAYSGRREADNRHCLFLTRLPTSSEAVDRSLFYKVFCTGGDGKISTPGRREMMDEGASSIDSTGDCMGISAKDSMLNVLFRRYYAPLLQWRCAQVIALLSYAAYLVIAAIGCGSMNVGMNYTELLPDGTPTSLYLEDYGRLFAAHSTPPLEVLVVDEDMSQTETQHAALQLVQRLEHDAFTGKAQMWLLDYLLFRDRLSDRSRDFYETIPEFLNQLAYRHYQTHLRFDPLNRRVTFRFLVDTHDLTYGHERVFLLFVKSALEQTALSNVTAFHTTFQLGEQQDAVLPAMLQSVGTATVVMLIVSFLLIPKLACSVCLAACIISTNLGVIGAMSLWGVRLDMISMITLLMSVGVSVDFVAHVSYFYVEALQKNMTASQAQYALWSLGLPIMQGALSTICGMLVLLAIDAYMIRAFVKTMMLVVIFGLYHGLVLLPIVMSLFIREDHIPKESTKPAGKMQPADKEMVASVMSKRRTPIYMSTSEERTTTDSVPPSVEPKLSRRSSFWKALNKSEQTDSDGGVPLTPIVVSKSRKVLNWLMQHDPALDQYPAYSTNSLHRIEIDEKF